MSRTTRVPSLSNEFVTLTITVPFIFASEFEARALQLLDRKLKEGPIPDGRHFEQAESVLMQQMGNFYFSATERFSDGNYSASEDENFQNESHPDEDL